MARVLLGQQAVRAIYQAVGALFARAKTRFLGRSYGPKQIAFGATEASPPGYRDDLSLGGIFDASARGEGMRPNPDLRDAVMRVAEQYLDAHEELAKARTVHAVQAFLSDAEAQDQPADAGVVLGGELSQLMGEVQCNIKGIMETEMTRASNLSAADAILKISALSGVSDPAVAFIGPNDTHTCDECRRLFFLPDGTPRVYHLSEVGHGYHKRGDDSPKMGGCHPNCRHTMVSIMPGYGFDNGKIKYVGPGHDELARQRSL